MNQKIFDGVIGSLVPVGATEDTDEKEGSALTETQLSEWKVIGEHRFYKCWLWNMCLEYV